MQTTSDDRCSTTQSKTLPHVVYNLFSLWELRGGFTARHKKQQPKKENVSVRRYCSSVHLQCHLRGGGTCVTIGGNSAEIVPLMKTNWRNQGSFLLPSQEANPNNMKLPKPRFSFAQKKGVRIHGQGQCMHAQSQVRINTTSTKRKGEYQHNKTPHQAAARLLSQLHCFRWQCTCWRVNS